MKTKKAIFTAALAASLAAIAQAAFPADAQILGAPVCEAAKNVTYEKDGIKLLVPEIYDDLLYTKIFKKDKEGKEDEEGRLFSVTEAKSVVDAWLQNERESGPGWLFTIARVDADRLHQMLCGEMSGADVFAKDSKNRYFIFYHPTDVRFVRKDEDKMRRDQQLWTDLNEWASLDVQHEFFENNKGLVKERYDNSNVSMYLARAAYSVEPKVKYTVSTNQYGPLYSDEVKAAPYVESLIRNATYEMVDINQTPDGQYVVLNFPDEKIRFDFFNLGDNYVREVHDDGYEILYKIKFDDGVTKASSVMQKWYNALAAVR